MGFPCLAVRIPVVCSVYQQIMALNMGVLGIFVRPFGHCNIAIIDFQLGKGK